MDAPTDPVVPKIDDRFWFDYSVGLINKGPDSRDQAAGKLQNLVIWLWGIYTSAAAIGFALSGKDLSIEATLTVLPLSFSQSAELP